MLFSFFFSVCVSTVYALLTTFPNLSIYLFFFGNGCVCVAKLWISFSSPSVGQASLSSFQAVPDWILCSQRLSLVTGWAGRARTRKRKQWSKLQTSMTWFIVGLSPWFWRFWTSSVPLAAAPMPSTFSFSTSGRASAHLSAWFIYWPSPLSSRLPRLVWWSTRCCPPSRVLLSRRLAELSCTFLWVAWS